MEIDDSRRKFIARSERVSETREVDRTQSKSACRAMGTAARSDSEDIFQNNLSVPISKSIPVGINSIRTTVLPLEGEKAKLPTVDTSPGRNIQKWSLMATTGSAQRVPINHAPYEFENDRCRFSEKSSIVIFNRHYFSSPSSPSSTSRLPPEN